MTSDTRPPLVLASSSAYRRELLERLRLPFAVDRPDVDETPLSGETPSATAARLALVKARVVALRHPGALVIGSDQVATLDGDQIGKPGDHARALAQLQRLRGRTVEFHSALCVFDSRNDSEQSAIATTTVHFRSLSDAELEAYLLAETPYDCAGSAKSEGLGIALLEKIDSDDPTALIGLPLIRLVSMLRHAGYSVLGD